MGKEFEREFTYVYVELNNFAVYLKLTQHCKSTINQYKINIKKIKNYVKLILMISAIEVMAKLSNSWKYLNAVAFLSNKNKFI